MDNQAIFLAIVFILVAAALFYMVLNLNKPPITYNFEPVNVSLSNAPGSECTSGQEAHCFVSGCPGVRRCSYGYWSECSLDRQCSQGETRACQYSGCSDGAQECGECSTWGPCRPLTSQNESSGSCNSSGV